MYILFKIEKKKLFLENLTIKNVLSEVHKVLLQ